MYSIDDIDIFIFNHERTTLLAETIESVLRSTIVPHKITVLDNDSTVNVKEITDKYKDFGVEYIRTSGLNGNYHKCLELASKKFMIRLHDDNLIHPEFFEKVLFVLNNIKNVVSVTSSYQLFTTNSDKTLPEEYPKSYLEGEHLPDNYMIFKSPKEFMYQHLKASVFSSMDKPIIGTPFWVIETDLFKKYVPQTDKYGKADDIDLFLWIVSKGYMVSIYDSRAAYFRNHRLRDSMVDDNSLTLKQAKDWMALFVSQFLEDKDEKLWRDVFEAVYQIYPSFIKKSVQEDYTAKDFIDLCIDENIIPEFCREYLKKVPNLKACRKLKLMQETKNVRKMGCLEKIFSVTNDYSKGELRKMIMILGIIIKI